MREREQRPRQSDGNRVRIECSRPGGVNFHIDQAPSWAASDDDSEDASPLSHLSPWRHCPWLPLSPGPRLLMVVVMYDAGSLPGLGWENCAPLPGLQPLDNCYEPGTSGDTRRGAHLGCWDTPEATITLHYITLHCMTQTPIRAVIHQQ